MIRKYAAGEIDAEKAEKKYRSLFKDRTDAELPLFCCDDQRLSAISASLHGNNRSIRQKKEELASLLARHDGVRALREEYVVDKNVISVFESMLTRTLGMQTGQLYDDFMVVRTYYFDVIRDMIRNGFLWRGEKYVCFTASAGQIRTKKTVFIKESVWDLHQKTLMCGLTVDEINKQGGININKYLAYLALCNSATDLWADFEIQRSIVVEDMETFVHGTVDFIDHNTYQCKRREMDIPIMHTDGCGMVLPSCCARNCMVRLPWIKGLLAVFPFDRFIREADARFPGVSHGLIRDIYGVEHDVLAEGIQVIFTKSQFKMWYYYKSWGEYIRLYALNGCTAGKCNVEESYLPDAKLNYQMLQTLTDITQEELERLSLRSAERIRNIAANRETMLDVFGASAQNRGKNAFQACLALYPELLSDPYTKETLRQIKKNMVRDARAAKLDISAKYLFLIPDLYAFCEWLFLGEVNPKGLLRDGEVSAGLYSKVARLDCLRSPHLYREHAVRDNVVNAETKRWFTPNAIYTSCHDLISRVLQFDCDGDKSLVCADPLLVTIAERNMQGVVPLYYEMAKAGAVIVTPDEIFRGLKAAWTGGNIGVISNDISKIWNSETPDLGLVGILTMENNFVIDYAKTLYKPTRPQELDQRLRSITSRKLPHFFLYAKGKTPKQVQSCNDSVVNRLEAAIPNKRMSFTAKNIGVFHHHYLLSDPKREVQIDPGVIALYDEVEKQYRYSMSYYEDETNYSYLRDGMILRFARLGYSEEYVCDMLVKYLFQEHQSTRKAVFWMCFGEIVLRNLQRNLPPGSIQCRKCGERFKPSAPNQKLCDECAHYQPVGRKTLVCCDCGRRFEVAGIVKNKKRCDECQRAHIRAYEREKKRRQRAAAACAPVSV